MNISLEIDDSNPDLLWFFSYPWAGINQKIRLAAMFTAVTGFFLNYLCFIAASEMPPSNSGYLMRHLAVWDSLAAFFNGFCREGLQYFGIVIENMNVS